MPKNCRVPIPSDQKKVLKVLTCLFENYIVNKTPSTIVYLSNPVDDSSGNTYDPMVEELNAIVTLINNYLETNGVLFDGDNVAIANIWVSDAQGQIQYFSDDVSGNTFTNAFNNEIYLSGNLNNVGVLKPVQKLNIDDCASKSYQVFPVVNNEGTNANPIYVNYSLSLLVERIGCAGVSNLGFLGFSIKVPIANAPFNTCSSNSCC